MRYIYISLLLFFSSYISYAQSVIKDGYYESLDIAYNSSGKDYLCFEGNSFKFLRLTDDENIFGTGIYEIRNDSLFLDFDEYPMKPNFSINQLDTILADSIVFDIEILDKKEKIGIIGVTLMHEKTKKRIVTDTEGKGQLILARSEVFKNDTLKTSFIGYRTEEIPINPEMPTRQALLIKLTSGYSYFGHGDLLEYSIRTIDSAFSLVIDDYTVQFRKSSRKSFNKSLKRFRKLAAD